MRASYGKPPYETYSAPSLSASSVSTRSDFTLVGFHRVLESQHPSVARGALAAGERRCRGHRGGDHSRQGLGFRCVLGGLVGASGGIVGGAVCRDRVRHHGGIDVRELGSIGTLSLSAGDTGGPVGLGALRIGIEHPLGIKGFELPLLTILRNAWAPIFGHVCGVDGLGGRDGRHSSLLE